ncbi:MAG: orotate phosphoribosyltransferase [Elusimicrobiota bacterium]
MNEKQVVEIFKDKGALLTGHFLLSSGLHSDKYVQCALVLQYPDIAEKLAKELVEKMKLLCRFAPRNDLLHINLVISPALGGVIIGQEIARLFSCRAIFAERENGQMKLRRGFEIRKKERVLIVEDVITTGKSTMEIASIVIKSGGKVIRAAGLVDRTGGEVSLGFPYTGLLKLKIKNYKPQDCPLCKKGMLLVKPGSRKSENRK